MMVEAFIAIRLSTLRAIRAELSKDEPNEAAMRAARLLRNAKGEGTWRRFTRNGQSAIVFSSTVHNPSLLERLDDLPGAAIVGAWTQDGAQLGQTIEEDGTVTGTPTWPIMRSLLLRAMPDLVSYDENGNETGRQRPTAPYQHHRYMGWAPRQYG